MINNKEQKIAPIMSITHTAQQAMNSPEQVLHN